MVSWFVVLMATGVLAPLILLARARPNGLGAWMLNGSAALAVLVFTVVAGPWVFLSLHLRLVALMAFAASAGVSFHRRTRSPTEQPASRRDRARFLATAVVLVAFGTLTMAALLGHRTPVGTTDVQVPFKAGTFAVLQGGGSPILNLFHSAAGERFAVDLVRVNVFGNRARGLAPTSLGAYESFGVPVHSPCEGVVEHAVGGLPDNPPGTADRHPPAGNHIVPRCETLSLLLAHLRQGSAVARAGERVRTGQMIGEVGNSGNTLEPHLHVSTIAVDQAAGRQGRAIPLTFGGRFLALNDTMRLRSP